MRTAIVAALCGAVVLVCSSSSFAQEFGSSGTLAFSADRLFGLYWHSHTLVVNGYDQTHSGTSFNMFFGNAASGWDSLSINPYSAPRLSFDAFVIDNLSIGGTLGYVTWSGETKSEPSGRTVDDLDRSMFVFGPRVGYGVMFTRGVGLWPRGGITYAHLTVDTNPDTDGWGLSLSMECPLLLSPVPNAAFTLGPTIDLGFAGKWSQGPEDGRSRLHNLGLAFGLLFYF